jgi:hypothetical protein
MSRSYISLLITVLMLPVASVAQIGKRDASVLVEKARFDWDHSGNPATFLLFRAPGKDGSDDPNRLIIRQAGRPDWNLSNRDDQWASLAETGVPAFKKQKKRLYFFSSGSQTNARVYLILKGVISGCCSGSLTILTPGEDGKPKIVFHESSYEAAALTPIDEDNWKLIGRSSDSEAWAVKNAQSYDPYRVYLFRGSAAAAYDPDLSKAYTESHYCQWHGPTYDEHFAAVGPTTGADTCRVMSREAFTGYQEKHPKLFQ